MSKRKSKPATTPWPKPKKQTSDAPAQEVGIVTLRLPVAQAEALQLGMADLLCWCAGFVAACPDEHSRHPMGVHQARELRIALNRALHATVGAASGADDDFDF